MSQPLTAITEHYIRLSDLRPKTETIYRAATRAFVRHFGETATLEDVDREQIIDWRKQLLDEGLSKRSWNTYSSHLKTIAKHGIEEGLVKVLRNPFHKTSVIPPKKQKKTVQQSAIERARQILVMLQDDERRLHKRAKITPAWFWLVVFETFHMTGIRLNALLCIRLKDIDFEQELMLIRGELEKTHRDFSVPIPADLLPHLRRLVAAAHSCGFEPDDQLFNVNRFSVYYRREEMNDNQVEAMYTKLIKMTGVRMTPHRFRHTLASDMMRQPERNLHLVKQLLNHSNLATTMEYIEPDYEVMRNAMEERIVAAKAKRRVIVRVDNTPQLSRQPAQHLLASPAPAVPLVEAPLPTAPLLLEHQANTLDSSPDECELERLQGNGSTLIHEQLLQLARLLQGYDGREGIASLLSQGIFEANDPLHGSPLKRSQSIKVPPVARRSTG